MNKITNEKGEIVTAIGSDGSPARMKCKYPLQIDNQVAGYIEQINNKVEHPIIEFLGAYEDRLHFIRAVHFYVLDELKRLKNKKD